MNLGSLPLPSLAPRVFAPLALATAAYAGEWVEVAAPPGPPVAALAASFASDGDVVAGFCCSAAAPGGAVSTDGGASWTRGWSPGAPFLLDLAVHPLDPRVVYAVNGETWKSVDGGRTWSLVFSDANPQDAVAVDPADPDRVYTVGSPVVPSGALHRSLDGGATWTSHHIFLSPHDVEVLRGDANAPSLVFVAADGGVFRSLDSGTTLEPLISMYRGHRLAVGTPSSGIVWALGEPVGGGSTIWRSTDRGRTWSGHGLGALEGKVLAAHPTDPSRAWLGTVEGGVLSTRDGGATWEPAIGTPPTMHVTSLLVAPWNSDELLAGGRGSSGGLLRSADGGRTWAPSGAGLGAAVPELRIDAGGRLWTVGLGAPWRRGESGTWLLLDHDQGATARVVDLATHPADERTVFCVTDPPEWWIPSRLLASRDDGRAWTDVTPPQATWSGDELSAVAVAVDGVVYAAGRSGELHVSGDLGATWGLRAGPWGIPRDLVADPRHPGVLHLTDNVDYYRSVDGGSTWSPAASGLTGTFSPRSLVVNETRPRELLVIAYSPGGLPDLYASEDAGESWTRVGAGLPATGPTYSGLTCVATDPRTVGRVLVGTGGRGVWQSRDHGGTFEPLGAGFEDASILALVFDRTRPGAASQPVEEVIRRRQRVLHPVATPGSLPESTLRLRSRTPRRGGCRSAGIRSTSSTGCWATTADGRVLGVRLE